MAGEIVKIIFLGENVGLRNFFAPSEAPQDYRAIGLRGDFGAALGVNAVGFAFAALLGVELRSARCGECHDRGDGEKCDRPCNKIIPPGMPRHSR